MYFRTPSTDRILVATALEKTYPRLCGVFARHEAVRALEGASLELRAAGILALVGESGSGKSTFGRCLALLELPDQGVIRFRNKDIASLPTAERREIRRKIQLVFQDPLSAMNPRFNAAQIVGEAYRIGGHHTEPHHRVAALAERVGLSSQSLTRSPIEFSGGQRQRLAIARALAAEPDVLILDEAFSGLDGATQAQIGGLLLELRRDLGLACIVIAHDLGFAGRLADEIAVMQHGRVVESGAAASILEGPRHPHTQALIEAIPQASAGTGAKP